VYVEPFAGGAQVLFAKEPSEVEVVSDLDPEIAFAFKFAQRVTPEQAAQLRRYHPSHCLPPEVGGFYNDNDSKRLCQAQYLIYSILQIPWLMEKH